MSHPEMFRWARSVLTGRPRPRIPGTLRELNKDVQTVLNNKSLPPNERGTISAGLITAKVLAAYRIK